MQLGCWNYAGDVAGSGAFGPPPSEASAKSESAKEEALLVTPVKPIGTFATRFKTVLRHFKELCDEKRKEDERFRVVVVGGGAGRGTRWPWSEGSPAKLA